MLVRDVYKISTHCIRTDGFFCVHILKTTPRVKKFFPSTFTITYRYIFHFLRSLDVFTGCLTFVFLALPWLDGLSWIKKASRNISWSFLLFLSLNDFPSFIFREGYFFRSQAASNKKIKFWNLPTYVRKLVFFFFKKWKSFNFFFSKKKEHLYWLLLCEMVIPFIHQSVYCNF